MAGESLQNDASTPGEPSESVKRETHESSPPHAGWRLSDLPVMFLSNYPLLHLGFFTCVIGVGTLFVWCLERTAASTLRGTTPPPAGVLPPVSFLDSLLLVASSMCSVGLVSKDISYLRRSSQIVLLACCLAGSLVFLSSAPIAIRRLFFRKLSGVPKGASKADITPADCEGKPYTYQQIVEYRALGKLLRIIISYFCVVQILGIVLLGVFLEWGKDTRALCASYNVNPFFAGTFLAISGFNNAGLSPFTDSIESFYLRPAPLLTMTLLVLLGNTFFPVALRGAICFQRWANARVRPAGGALSEARRARDLEALDYLLANPRRCSAYLFPGLQTKALAAINLGFILVQMIGDWMMTRPPFDPYQSSSWATRTMDNLAQAVSTRAAGFEVVDVSRMNPSLWLLLIALMLIGSYPYIVTMRLTAEDEERRREAMEAGPASKRKSMARVAAAKARRLATSELSLLFLAAQAIAMSELGERAKGERAATRQDLVKIVFETTSAFGNVGLSLGEDELAPGASFCATFNAFSKLVLIAVMIYGRHRGLPSSLDAAVVEIGMGVRRGLEAARRPVAPAKEELLEAAAAPAGARRRLGSLPSRLVRSFDGDPRTRAKLAELEEPARRAADPAGGAGVPLPRIEDREDREARKEGGTPPDTDGSMGGGEAEAPLLGRANGAHTASTLLQRAAGLEGREADRTPPPPPLVGGAGTGSRRSAELGREPPGGGGR